MAALDLARWDAVSRAGEPLRIPGARGLINTPEDIGTFLANR